MLCPVNTLKERYWKMDLYLIYLRGSTHVYGDSEKFLDYLVQKRKELKKVKKFLEKTTL